VIWTVCLTSYDNAVGYGTIFIQTEEGRMYPVILESVNDDMVRKAVAQTANIPIERVQLKESPKRRRDTMTVWEFMVFYDDLAAHPEIDNTTVATVDGPKPTWVRGETAIAEEAPF